MQYYRMMSEKYYQDPYSSSFSGGRWNPKGTPMIYAGSSAALAALEYLSIKGTAASLEPWHVVIYQIDDTSLIGTLDKGSLPDFWDILPHGNATQEFGRLWLSEKRFPFLKVPSARLHVSFFPEEHNLLVNPIFPNLGDIFKVVDSRRFEYRIGT